MKSRAFTSFVAMILFASLALPVQLTAQHTQYKLIDLGTFGFEWRTGKPRKSAHR